MNIHIRFFFYFKHDSMTWVYSFPTNVLEHSTEARNAAVMEYSASPWQHVQPSNCLSFCGIRIVMHGSIRASWTTAQPLSFQSRFLNSCTFIRMSFSCVTPLPPTQPHGSFPLYLPACIQPYAPEHVSRAITRELVLCVETSASQNHISKLKWVALFNNAK